MGERVVQSVSGLHEDTVCAQAEQSTVAHGFIMHLKQIASDVNSGIVYLWDFPLDICKQWLAHT